MKNNLKVDCDSDLNYLLKHFPSSPQEKQALEKRVTDMEEELKVRPPL